MYAYYLLSTYRTLHFKMLHNNEVDDAIELSGVLTSDFDDDCKPAAWW